MYEELDGYVGRIDPCNRTWSLVWSKARASGALADGAGVAPLRIQFQHCRHVILVTLVLCIGLSTSKNLEARPFRVKGSAWYISARRRRDSLCTGQFFPDGRPKLALTGRNSHSDKKGQPIL